MERRYWGVAQLEELNRQAAAEVRVESQALAQLHARWAARTGVSPDPQVDASMREVVRLVNGIERRWTLIEGKKKAASSGNEAA